ncbi:MAG: hypothetical protein NZ480_01100 [Bdellovibrionaceae bacterium]|nr:hypothetical protein [Pseudobdellovibrionaceae bacterium]MDW8190786.1 hypothetical protein [Pseudobdellovibrionaceae bacterium]
MGHAVTFLEVLENKIRKELWKEMNQNAQNEVNNPHSIPIKQSHSYQSLDLLDRLSNLNLIKKQQPKAGPNPYPHKAQIQQPPFLLSPKETEALAFLNQLGASLKNPFTLTQLKRVRRQLFLKYHPDHGGNTEQFRQIQESFGLLQKYLMANRK